MTSPTTTATPIYDMTDNMRGPDFLVIGAQRAGTTWIHFMLLRHRSLWMPPVKELHYFDRPEVRRTVTDRRELRRAVLSPMFPPRPWHVPYLFHLRSDDWYRRLFHRAQARGLITGEVTPAYATLDEDGLRRIRALNNEIKLVFVMRDPVERTWSAVNNAFKKKMIRGGNTIGTSLKGARSKGAQGRGVS
jgi:hypothetical protein